MTTRWTKEGVPVAICNHDCFNCLYPDCINNGPPKRGELAAVDEILRPTKTPSSGQQEAADSKKEMRRRSYLRNAEKCRAYAKAYYQAHKKKKRPDRSNGQDAQRVDNPNNKVILPPTDKIVKRR